MDLTPKQIVAKLDTYIVGQKKAKKAVDLYGKNFNCSQAVLTAFAEDFGLSEKLTLSLGTSFGGGARNGQLCGAVSGALMVLGLKFGHFESENQEQKSKN